VSDSFSFTGDSARRIANVVRRVEGRNPGKAGPVFGTRLESLPDRLSLATFTADWDINEYQEVTFHDVTSTPNTASVLNLCTPSVGFDTNNTTEQRFVIFGRVRFTSDPVVVEIQQQNTGTCTLTLGGLKLEDLPGYEAEETQMLGHEPDGCLRWYTTVECDDEESEE